MLKIIMETTAFRGDLSSNKKASGTDFIKGFLQTVKTTLRKILGWSLVVDELEIVLTEIESVILMSKEMMHKFYYLLISW